MFNKHAFIKLHATHETRCICKICGGEYELLSRHLISTHKMKVKDYKITYKIPFMVPLCSEDFSKSTSENAMRIIHNGPNHMAKMSMKHPPGSSNGWEYNSPLNGTLSDRARKYRELKSDKANKLWESRKEMFTHLWNTGVYIRGIAEFFDCSERTIRSKASFYKLKSRNNVDMSRL